MVFCKRENAHTRTDKNDTSAEEKIRLQLYFQLTTKLAL